MRQRCRSFGFVLVSLFVCSPLLPAWADDIEELDSVLVSARRIPGLTVNTEEFPGNATVITPREIARSGTTSLPQLLRGQEGVTFGDPLGFGLGADSTVNLRGIVNSARTGALVLVDGIPQNRITGDEVHWQAIPLEAIERIEIIRGGSSLIYGEGALSGVINIITKKGADKPVAVSAGADVGSFGYWQAFTSGRCSTGPATYGASFNRKMLTGYRESTNSRTSTATTHFGIDLLPSLHVETNVLHSEDTSYFPGGITPEQSQERRRQKGDFSGFIEGQQTQVGLQTVWQAPEGFSLVTDAFFSDRESDSASSFGRLATLTPSEGLSVRGSHDALLTDNVRHTLVTGIDLSKAKASTGFRTGTYSESNKAGYGLFAEETVRLFDRASLVTGVRYDRVRYEEAISFPSFVGTLLFAGWSPKAAVSIDIVKPVTVYGSVSRPYKAPNVDDFSVFVPTGGLVGNVDLKPQQGTEYETGVRASDPRFGQAHVSFFYNTINDEILFNAQAFQNQNYDTLHNGVEVEVKPAVPVPNLQPTFTYTHLEAEFRKGDLKGNTIPGVFEHQFTTRVDYTVLPGLSMYLDWNVVRNGFRINDFANALPMHNYETLDVGLSYTWRNVMVHFRIENVTNEEYTTFQSSSGTSISTGENPAPPRSYFAGVTVSF